jgi:hypothetical protein
MQKGVCSSQNQLSCKPSNVNYGNNTKFFNNANFFQGNSFRTFLFHVTFTLLHLASSCMFCCLKHVIKERRKQFMVFFVVKFLSSFICYLFPSFSVFMLLLTYIRVINQHEYKSRCTVNQTQTLLFLSLLSCFYSFAPFLLSLLLLYCNSGKKVSHLSPRKLHSLSQALVTCFGVINPSSCTYM